MSPTSPRQIQIDPNLPASHPRSMSMISPALSPSRALNTRRYRDDAEGARERQMQQDIESAMSMSRARSGSLAPEATPPLIHRSSHQYPSNSPIEENPFPMLSDAEEAEMFRARTAGRHDDDNHSEQGRMEYRNDEDDGREHLGQSASSGYHSDRRLLPDEPESRTLGGMNSGRNTFDFGAMEEFAGKEKVNQERTEGAWIPERKNGESMKTGQSYDTALDRTATMSPFGQNSSQGTPPEFHRRRQRKLSQSNPILRRQGKLALFEGATEEDSPFKAPRQPKNALAKPAFESYTDAGHDRPYRFSFYSNALPVTIHARSLAELPAENQTFEDLFKGKSDEVKPEEEDPEAVTWWLDVLSPTDEEMRMLSKVFGIHPLTTEDILLEETREKIELFRNYYLVCFRSFDQDPYSQTYLEPLNMYIIVFREGTLSFHFRGTPHPQNVRRRIKHLKDYISVTSDWISYALIDDITDAFGPLIQSIEYEVDSIDELVLILKEAEQSDMLRRIGTCRKKVMGLLRLMGNKADVVKGLAKRCNENWLVAPKSDIGLYLSDIQDHLITMTQNLNHYEKILSRSHSNYLAQISIEMTDANNQINDVLSKLTALGTVLIPMNLVTGLWGMNVHVPGQDITDGYTWFGSILGGLGIFAIVGAFATYKCFKR